MAEGETTVFVTPAEGAFVAGVIPVGLVEVIVTTAT